MIRPLVALMSLAVLTAAPTAVLAGDHGGRYRGAPPEWDEAIGCYAFRGRMTCSRYCWRDINGRRYCHERERYAYPHGWAIYEASRPKRR